MPGPILRIDGIDEIQDSGITLGDLLRTYPGCYLRNGNRAHCLPTFILQDDVSYELVLPNAGKD